MADELSGIIILNKPAGISSARAVSQVKRLLPRGTKIGHAGTLDPFATGVLLLLIGKATKQSELLMGQPKKYEATVRFGATTETDDLDSPATPYPDAVLPTRESIEAALPQFVGSVQQQPPTYSALKVGGRRAYQLARQGQSVALAPRTVRIDAIELLDYAAPDARLRIDCGRGTYIRAIARDLGAVLHCGGYLTQLCRTGIGRFTLDQAIDLPLLTDATLKSRLMEL